MKRRIVLIPLLVLMAFAEPPKKIKVWLIGDSTMANKEVKAYPETGWGMPFVYFFDSTVTIDNRAVNGRSTKTFIAENRWNPVVEDLQEGDYVFIQFGHNDEVKTKASYTTEEEFSNNLKRYISDARSKKAIPVLLTPVARRQFDSSGKIVGTHDAYSALVRRVAQQAKVPLIDIDLKSQAVLQEMGAQPSKYLFNHLVKGQHPNYPGGKIDNTHFNEFGARRMAEIVLAEIRNLKLDLATRIVKQK
jgi:lysophospholipase L1-like esterase